VVELNHNVAGMKEQCFCLCIVSVKKGEVDNVFKMIESYRIRDTKLLGITACLLAGRIFILRPCLAPI